MQFLADLVGCVGVLRESLGDDRYRVLVYEPDGKAISLAGIEQEPTDNDCGFVTVVDVDHDRKIVVFQRD